MRCLGLLPSDTLASPLFLFLVWGLARGDPTWGLSVSFGVPCSVCFLFRSSPGLGGCFSPRKSDSRPSLRGVCVRSGRTHCHHLPQGAWRSPRSHANEAIEDDWMHQGRLDVYLHQFCKYLFGPWVAALFVLLVLSGNVFAARRKPSECKPNLHPLETHQL